MCYSGILASWEPANIIYSECCNMSSIRGFTHNFIASEVRYICMHIIVLLKDTKTQSVQIQCPLSEILFHHQRLIILLSVFIRGHFYCVLYRGLYSAHNIMDIITLTGAREIYFITFFRVRNLVLKFIFTSKHVILSFVAADYLHLLAET